MQTSPAVEQCNLVLKVGAFRLLNLRAKLVAVCMVRAFLKLSLVYSRPIGEIKM